MTQILLSRRSMFFGSLALAGTLAAPSLALAKAARPRTLLMTNPRTNETYNRVIHNGNAFLRDALDEFNWFARDWRQHEETRMDPTTMAIASDMQARLGGAEMVLFSGYRTPRTNRMLDGTAKRSYHMRGMAMDVHVPSVSTNQMYTAAWKNIHRGGVGKYSRSKFVHIDSGPVRTWGS